GREALTIGDPTTAALILRQALELWRGPALADLVEAGITWPELSALENGRRDAMEDLFDAELARGRHQVVLGELEHMVENTGLRERAHAQLMIALYRSGRQADALNVYSRVRSVLVEELGLEPGRELQTLQQAILSQDPALNLPGDTTWQTIRYGSAALTVDGPRPAAPARAAPPVSTHPPRFLPGQPPPVRTSADHLTVAKVRPDATAAGDHVDAHDAGRPTNGQFLTESPTITSMRQRHVSVLLVRAQLDAGSLDDDPYAVDEILEDVSRWVQKSIEKFGGFVTAAIGSVSMAVFDTEPNKQEHPQRAVLAALAIREGFRSAAHSPPAPSHEGRLLSQAAVATGTALVCHRPDDPDQPLSISGSLLNLCDSLLGRAQTGEIRVCETTRARTMEAIDYRAAGGWDDAAHGSDWTVTRARRREADQHLATAARREVEIALLTGLLERSRYQSTPRMVTILGEPGSGKTHLLAEFAQLSAARSRVVRFAVDQARHSERSTAAELRRTLVLSLCDAEAPGGHAVMWDRLARTVTRLTDDVDEARQLLRGLHPLVEPDHRLEDVIESATRSIACRQFMRLVAHEQPVVLLVDDLHLADHVLSAFVSGLTRLSDVPLLLVATTEVELALQDPVWEGAESHVATLALEPLPEFATDLLLDVPPRFVTIPQDPDADGAVSPSRALVQVDVAGPRDARSHLLRAPLQHQPARQVRHDPQSWDDRLATPSR
ncbi:BTAD domain-containing putative transcriptional regulator, partial [Pseudofrankia asymbiotica]